MANKDRIEDIKAVVAAALGDDYAGMSYDEAAGQLAFFTNEPDAGEGVKARHIDDVEEAIRGLGLRRCPCMPLAVKGRILYVVAGMNR